MDLSEVAGIGRTEAPKWTAGRCLASSSSSAGSARACFSAMSWLHGGDRKLGFVEGIAGFNSDVARCSAVAPVGRKAASKSMARGCFASSVASLRPDSGEYGLRRVWVLDLSSRRLQGLRNGTHVLAWDGRSSPNRVSKLDRKVAFLLKSSVAVTSWQDSGESGLRRWQGKDRSSRGLQDLHAGILGSAWEGRSWLEITPEVGSEGCKTKKLEWTSSPSPPSSLSATASPAALRRSSLHAPRPRFFEREWACVYRGEEACGGVYLQVALG